MIRWHDPGRAAKVAAFVSLGVLATLILANPVLAQETPAVTAGIFQAALVGIGYYLSNSPWLFGNGGFFGLYRPLVAGLFVGLIFGDPVKGAQIGASINLLYIGFISAGGSIPADPSVAGWVGTALAMAGNLSAEAAISLGVAIGLLGTIIFFTRMSVDSLFAHWADARAEVGDISGVARMNWLPPQIFLFVISFIPAFLAVYLGSDVVKDAIIWLNGDPFAGVAGNAPWVLKGFEIAGGLLPAIGIALNMRFIFRGGAIPFYFIGYVLALIISGSFTPNVTHTDPATQVTTVIGQLAGPAVGTVVVTIAILGAAFGWMYVTLLGRSSQEGRS